MTQNTREAVGFLYFKAYLLSAQENVAQIELLATLMKQKSRTTQMQFELRVEADGYTLGWSGSSVRCKCRTHILMKNGRSWHIENGTKSQEEKLCRSRVSSCPKNVAVSTGWLRAVKETTNSSTVLEDYWWKISFEPASVIPRLNQLLWFTPSSR